MADICANRFSIVRRPWRFEHESNEYVSTSAEAAVSHRNRNRLFKHESCLREAWRFLFLFFWEPSSFINFFDAVIMAPLNLEQGTPSSWDRFGLEESEGGKKMKRIVVDILDDDEGAITLEDALTGKVAEDTVLEKLGVDGSDEPRHKRRSLSFSDRGGKKRDGGKGSPTSSKEKPSEPAVPQSAPRAASSKDAPEASKPADVVLIEDDERDDTTAVDIVQEISRHSESSEASSEAFLEGLTALQFVFRSFPRKF